MGVSSFPSIVAGERRRRQPPTSLGVEHRTGLVTQPFSLRRDRQSLATPVPPYPRSSLRSPLGSLGPVVPTWGAFPEHSCSPARRKHTRSTRNRNIVMNCTHL